MYHIRRMFARHIEENLVKYILMISVFATGILLGFLFSQSISEDLSEVIRQEIGTLITGFSNGDFDKLQILQTSFIKNLRIILFIFIGGFSAFLLPLAFSSLLSYGFSIGFTISYLSIGFGGQGLAIAVVSIILAFIINIPTYISLSVVAFNNCRNKKYRDGNFAAYILVFVFLSLISLISVVADAFVIPIIITLICS